MRKLTILVDLDDVLWEFLSHWINKLNEKYNKAVHFNDIKEWSLHSAYPELSRKELFSVLNDKGFWDGMKPKKGAVKYLKQLIDDGHNVYIATQTHWRDATYKFETLLKLFPFINSDSIITISHKQLLNADFLIDDNICNLQGGKYKGLLFAMPHNVNLVLDDNIIRVNNWEEIYSVITNTAVSDDNLLF